MSYNFDPNMSPKLHAGLQALLTAIDAHDEIPRTDAIHLIVDAGLAPTTADAIIRAAGRYQWTRSLGKKRNGNDQRTLTAGPRFNEAPR